MAYLTLELGNNLELYRANTLSRAGQGSVANREEEASLDPKSLHGDFKESMSLLS